MLNSIHIEGLFNLYTYRIPLDGPSPIHFLTAPNGYGKTTILDIVSSVLKANFSALMDIPFKQVSLTLEHNTISIVRSETYPVVEGDSDEEVKPYVKLTVTLSDYDREVESIELDANSFGSYSSDYSSDFAVGKRSANIDMFLRSIPCNYIRDDRILEKKTDRYTRISDIGKGPLQEYVRRVKAILNEPLETQKYSDRLSLFKSAVNGLGLSNKEMEVHPSFGFRMVSTDKIKEIIPMERLSSGEKHVLVQLCEMLFCSQEGTLVLVDEPELSLHMAWQYQYLPVLKQIASLCGFQFLIATHSPQIFNAEWSLTTDLFMEAQGK